MTQPGAWRSNSDDEDDMDEREPWMWNGKNAYIFLIDATELMFEKNIDDVSYFQTGIEACKKIFLKAVHDMDKHYYGIVLYGTKHKGQASQANHITTLQSLSALSADKIKELINILDDVDNFEKENGHSNDFSLAEALWHCLKMFSSCTTKIHEKHILLMTCNDNPHAPDPKLQQDTRTRASEFSQLMTELRVLPFGISFNPDLFFKEVVEMSIGDNVDLNKTSDDDLDVSKIRIVKDADDILSYLQVLPKKRSTARVLWTLGADVQLGIAAYSLVKTTDPTPKLLKITRSKNSIVTAKPQVFNATTGEEVSVADVSRAIPIAGKTVTFEKEELRTLKYISQPGLVLLGFKPTATYELWYQKKASLFVYPEERLVKGSRTLFAALHERCLARDVTPICFFTARRGGRPQIVSLLPQAEKLDENNTQILPAGFILRYVPYADNIRDLDDQVVVCPEPDAELVSIAEKVISKTKFKYNPHSIDNPKVQKVWAGVEALALGYENPEDIGDTTLPDHEIMDKRMGDLAAEFMAMAFPDGFSEAALATAVKRAAAASRPPPAKRAKPDLGSMSMQDMATQGLVEKLKVDALKTYLAEEGVGGLSRMKKADLVEAVYNHLGIPDPTG